VIQIGEKHMGKKIVVSSLLLFRLQAAQPRCLTRLGFLTSGARGNALGGNSRIQYSFFDSLLDLT